MQGLKNLFLILIFSCIASLLVVGQAFSQDDMRQAASDKLTADLNKNINGLLAPVGVIRTVESWRSRVNSRFEDSLPSADKARIKKILAPDARIAVEHKNFLKQKRTGLFRLFPDFGCDQSKSVVRVDGNCADAISGSWKYSFRRKDYLLTDFFDIKLKDGKLISRGFLAQGILVELGDIALENISSGSNISGTEFLFSYAPANEIEKAKKQFAEISDGISSNGFNYTNSINAAEGKTYALRTIAYRDRIDDWNRWDKITPDELRFLVLNYDKRIDSIIVFRIIKKDADGSLTILWKELSRKKSPQIVFGKNDKLMDIK